VSATICRQADFEYLRQNGQHMTDKPASTDSYRSAATNNFNALKHGIVARVSGGRRG
jgi:hypothetical protein